MHRAAPFIKKLHRAIERDPSLEVHAQAIELYNELRNLIVHNGADVAVPLPSTVHGIERVLELLDAPPQLAAFHRPVISCSLHDSIASVAKWMATEDFSQLPVLDGHRVCGVVTTAAIAHWLGSHSHDPVVDLSTPVRDVAHHEEYPNAWRVFAINDLVGRALAAFKEAADNGEPLYAIVLTRDGKHNSSLEGVVTLSDLPALWRLAMRLS